MKEFAAIFIDATRDIIPDYFQLPVAGREDPIYRERVYCYELYHQLRLRWPAGTEYSLCGEIDKNGHGLIRGNDLDNKKPDFLVHVPGVMEQNYLVMEVKSENAHKAGIEKDLRTLTAFCTKGEYSRAILLVYGSSETAFDRIKATSNFLADSDENGRIRLDLIELWHHSNPKIEAQHVEW